MDLRLMSSSELAAELGSRVQRERLRQDLTQRTLAARAGLSRPTIARLEADGTTTLESFLAVLTALGRVDDLAPLLQPPPARTVAEFLDEQPTRRRGRR